MSEAFQSSHSKKNYKQLPLSVAQTIGRSLEALSGDMAIEQNSAGFRFDDVSFEFWEEAVEIRAPSWSLTVFIHQSDDTGTTYAYHLKSVEAAP
jgi:hypothetical protein